MPIETVDQFVLAYRNLDSSWCGPYRAVRGVCAAFPEHTDVPATFTKVALVDRVYRTNMRYAGGDADWRVARALVGNALDHILILLTESAALSAENAQQVVSVYVEALGIIHGATGRWEASFTSKYLHFHFPTLVPILDDKARRTLNRLVGARLGEMGLPNRGNLRYARQVHGTLLLKGFLLEAGVERPALHLIDRVLYTGV